MSRRTLLVALALACGPAGTDTSDPPRVASFTDSDGDGIADVHEGGDDVDGDGRPNLDDPDSDGDGLPDAAEAGDDDLATLPFDTDGDQIPDYLDDDSDDNGIADAVEGLRRGGGVRDYDGDGVHDAADFDNDGDGLLDVWEGSDDPDADSKPAHRDEDSDDDGIEDRFEGHCPTPRAACDADEDGTPDRLQLDADADGISDAEERGTMPPAEPLDTDRDGTDDYRDLDSDGDGVSDTEEGRLGTDRLRRDTDGDGQTDKVELELGTDPTDPESRWGGLYVEVKERTQREESYTFNLALRRVDVMVLVGKGGSQFFELLRPYFDPVIAGLTARVDDVGVGFAAVGTYRACPWSLAAESPCYGWTFEDFGITDTERRIVPLHAIHPITTDLDLVRAEWEAFRGQEGGKHYFASTPMEAIYQLASGAGIDLDCDGRYDPLEDVRPMVANATDVFGGAGGQLYDPSRPGAGVRGSAGFRGWATPLIVWVTGVRPTDPSLPVSPLPPASTDPRWAAHYFEGPGACGIDAGSVEAGAAVRELGAHVLLGVPYNINSDLLIDPYRTDPWYSLLAESGSVRDLDGDGEPEPMLVEFSANGDDDPTVLRDSVLSLVDNIESELTYDSVRLEIEGDTRNLVADISPREQTGFADGRSVVDFTLTFEGSIPAREGDQVVRLWLNAVGDGTHLLDRQEIVVVIPGRQWE